MRNAMLVWFGLALMSCSGSQSASGFEWSGRDDATGTNVTIHQGAMPQGQTFTGVYRSPQIGDIEIVQTGDSVVGRYEYDRGDCHVRATLEGSASGNLFRFTWREDHRQCGRLAAVQGRGFFLLTVETDGEVQRARIFGRWGYQNDDHSGGPWTGFKQPGRQPTMLESGGDNSGGSSGGGNSGGGNSGGGSTDNDAGTSGTSGSGGGDPLQGI